jgi:acetamidase/formamidase
MLGCFGVAPARGHLHRHVWFSRGNIDYNGCVAGATAYFPVFA